MRWYVGLWAALVLGCAEATSSPVEGEGSGPPDAGLPRSERARADAGIPDEPPEPLPISGCGQGIPNCPGTGGAGTEPPAPTPSMPTESPRGPGPDPSPID